MDEYEDFGSSWWNRAMQLLKVMEQDHPFSVDRVKEISKYVESDEYALVKKLMDGKVRICPHCHQTIEEGWNFCHHCGGKL